MFNKSNSTTEVVRAEANLQEQPSDYLQFWPCNVGHGHIALLLQWFHSMENFKIYRSQFWHFCTSSHRFQNLKYLRYLTWISRSRWRSTIFEIALFDDKNKICKRCMTNFLGNSHRFVNINIWNIRPWKVGQDRNGAVRWQISKSIKTVSLVFALALNVCEVSTISAKM